jgi:DNA-binding transcriptional regulator YiaG
VVATVIDAPWVVTPPAEAPDWEFDVGPFAGTPTSYEYLGALFTRGQLIPSSHYGWAVGEFITVSAPGSPYTIRPVGLGALGSLYSFPAGTLTSLELVREDYAIVFTTSTFKALRALTLHRARPWSRFLAGLDPVPSTQTPTVAAPHATAAATTELEAPESRELVAVEELREWLGLTYEQIAAATSIGLRTVHHWKQMGTAPRPRTVRTLWRLHALVHSIRRTLGVDEAMRWLRTGMPSPVDLIVAGELATVEDQARRLLFIEPIGERRFSGVPTEDEPASPVTRRGRSVCRATRRPRIVRRETGR